MHCDILPVHFSSCFLTRLDKNYTYDVKYNILILSSGTTYSLILLLKSPLLLYTFECILQILKYFTKNLVYCGFVDEARIHSSTFLCTLVGIPLKITELSPTFWIPIHYKINNADFLLLS